MSHSHSRGEQPKTILLLGGTGSVGTQVLEVVGQHPDKLRVKTMVCGGGNPAQIARLAKDHSIETIAVSKPQAVSEIQVALGKYDALCTVHGGQSAIIDSCQGHHDICVAAISGMAGLLATVAAIPHCDVLAIANKETIICAGHLLTDLVQRHGVKLLPLDSEHSAIFDILCGHGETPKTDGVRRLILTASGGPLWTLSPRQMRDVTLEMVLQHPTWKMGPKISVDSATMINKGFEMIEASHLFAMGMEQISAVVHRQSLVHGIVEYEDGTSMMQAASNTMKIPIAKALFWPRRNGYSTPSLDLVKQGMLTFEDPDNARFPLLGFTQDCWQQGQQAIIALNAANEAVVEAFLSEQIEFSMLANLVMKIVNQALAETHKLSHLSDVVSYHDQVTFLAQSEISRAM